LNNVGTTANVSVQLFGVENKEDNEISSGTRHLSRPGAFKRSGIDSFVVATDRPLGVVHRVHIWHDNTGNKPSWYLTGLIVRDLQSNECRHFVADRWLSLSTLKDGGSEIEAVLCSPGEIL